MKGFNEEDYFVLFGNCVPTKGAVRSLISDYQRNCYFYIPNDLYEVLELSKTLKLVDIYSKYTSENRETLDEYFDFLIGQDLGFIDNEREVFPEINMEWDAPSEITNAILDVSYTTFNKINYAKIIRELSELNCFCVQIRVFDEILFDDLKSLMKYTLNTRMKDVRLVLKYSPELDDLCRKVLVPNHRRLAHVIFFSAPDQKMENVMGARFDYRTMPKLSETDCGHVGREHFVVDISHHTESIRFNSCLNRKLSVDSEGNIKNCPSQSLTYGNANEISLVDIIKDAKFRAIWSLKKDDINICRDCEHRYICTDCRIFIQDPNDQYSKPAKCKYDPYTAAWD